MVVVILLLFLSEVYRLRFFLPFYLFYLIINFIYYFVVHVWFLIVYCVVLLFNELRPFIGLQGLLSQLAPVPGANPIK